MTVFSNESFTTHEQVVFCHDRHVGLKAIIAIHNTARGPALGGCRMWAYHSEGEAITDVLRLSRGMTYKSALANLPLGGGKSVIIGNPKTDKTPELFEAMGRFVDTLGGRYIAAEDVGIGVEDVVYMSRSTKHVAGIPEGGVGDPSPATAWGVFQGIRAAVKHRLGRDDLDGIKVAVQGVGHVGYYLCEFLAGAGARLIVTDIDQASIDRVVNAFNAIAVEPGAIYDVDADVFAPCALGAVINDATIPTLKVKVVAGSANNQLGNDSHDNALAERGILYAPDYVINAGGIIAISHEGPGYDKDETFAHVAGIHDTLLEIFGRAAGEGVTTAEAADAIAEERILAAEATKKTGIAAA